MPDDIVTCKKCGTENPRGQDHCNSCGSLLPGHSFAYKPGQSGNPDGPRSEDKQKKRALDMLAKDGIDWDELDGSQQLITMAAVSTKATAADRKAYLQNVSERLKPAPKIGGDHDKPIEKVVIEAEQIENAKQALADLRAFKKSLGD